MGILCSICAILMCTTFFRNEECNPHVKQDLCVLLNQEEAMIALKICHA